MKPCSTLRNLAWNAGPLILFSLLPAGARAQQPANPAQVAAKAPSGDLLIDRSPAEELPKWLQIRGQIRGRFESPSGTSMINSSPDAYYLSRIRVDLAIKPASWLKFFAQAQDARPANTSMAPTDRSAAFCRA